MKNMTCCFTGHRDLPQNMTHIIKERTALVVRALITQRGVRYFGVGGAIGYDTLVAQVLFMMKKEYPHIKVILVYPFPGFTSHWNEAQKSTYDKLLPLYDKVVCMTSTPSKEAYLARDRHLVDESAYCVSYCTRSTGGTAYTVSYARQQGIKIVNVAK